MTLSAIAQNDAMADNGWQRCTGCPIFIDHFCAKELYNSWLFCGKRPAS